MRSPGQTRCVLFMFAVVGQLKLIIFNTIVVDRTGILHSVTWSWTEQAFFTLLLGLGQNRHSSLCYLALDRTGILHSVTWPWTEQAFFTLLLGLGQNRHSSLCYLAL